VLLVGDRCEMFIISAMLSPAVEAKVASMIIDLEFPVRFHNMPFVMIGNVVDLEPAL
jgi:hypothetical protein